MVYNMVAGTAAPPAWLPAAADSSSDPLNHPVDRCRSVDDGLYEPGLGGAEWEFEGEEPGMPCVVQA